MKMRAASEKESEERCPEQGWDEHAGKDCHACPEGGGYGRAIEQGGSGCFGPPSGSEEQGCGEGSGEQPAGVVTEWPAVIDAALGPHPEAQGGCTRIEDGIHPAEEKGGVEDVEETQAGPPRGCYGPDDERRVGEGQEVRDDSGEAGSEGVAVVESAVGEASRDADRLYGVGQAGEACQGERGPAWAEVAEECDGRGQGDQEGRYVGASARALYARAADGEHGCREAEGGGASQG